MDEVIGITDVLLTVLKILIAILVFGLIIFIHELGHFFMARLMGEMCIRDRDVGCVIPEYNLQKAGFGVFRDSLFHIVLSL